MIAASPSNIANSGTGIAKSGFLNDRSRLRCVWCSGAKSADRGWCWALAVEVAISANKVAGRARMSRMIVDARVCRWKDKDGGWMLAASRRWHKDEGEDLVCVQARLEEEM